MQAHIDFDMEHMQMPKLSLQVYHSCFIEYIDKFHRNI